MFPHELALCVCMYVCMWLSGLLFRNYPGGGGGGGGGGRKGEKPCVCVQGSLGSGKGDSINGVTSAPAPLIITFFQVKTKFYMPLLMYGEGGQ